MAAIGRVLLIPKGDYSGSTAYNALDWVRNNGAAWVCKVDNTIGIAPPTLPTTSNANWQLLSADGTVSGSIDWSNVNNKPFNSVGNGLNVNASKEIELDTSMLTGSNISYDNTASGLTATDMQDAIDELAGMTVNLSTDLLAGSNITITPKPNGKVEISSTGGGGGGSSTFAGLSDTDISSPQDNQIVQYATVSGNKVLQNVTMDALPTQNSAKPVTSGGAYTALSGKASTSALDEWTSGAQTLDGETFVFDNLDDTYGYDLFGDDKLYTITNFAKGTGTNTGTIKLTYTVSGASIGDYGYLRIFK